MLKSLTEFDYQVCLNILNGAFIDYNDLDNYVIHWSSNPEVYVQKKDLFDKSSKEVRELLTLIVTKPYFVFGPKLKRNGITESKISYLKIVKYLRRKGLNKHSTDIKLKELRYLLRRMVEIA